MVGAKITGDKIEYISEEQVKEESKSQKMYPCEVCGVIFSWDEQRIMVLKNGVMLWIHPSCKDKVK